MFFQVLARVKNDNTGKAYLVNWRGFGVGGIYVRLVGKKIACYIQGYYQITKSFMEETEFIPNFKT